MANQNGKKYGFTALFPIKPGEHVAKLRLHLRSLDGCVNGSPLSRVDIVHMARFVIVDLLPYQGVPAKTDVLNSAYLLFVCEFDGSSSDSLVQALVQAIRPEVDEIWQHCGGFPGSSRVDDLADYFSRCQLETTLLLADRPDDSLEDILRALLYKRQFSELVLCVQEQRAKLNPADLKTRIQKELRKIVTAPPPPPGSM
jgi:hypothetical protein